VHTKSGLRKAARRGQAGNTSAYNRNRFLPGL
jgi:hypothetical protein